jgi:predicted nucleic acid-binding protein
MRALLDACIILDMLLARTPWDLPALAIWQAGLRGRIECCITATTITNIHYIGRRLAGADRAREFVATCLREATILPVDFPSLQVAFDLGSNDYEDAVQLACARHHRVDYIVTRDGSFGGRTGPMIDPIAFLALIPADPHAETGQPRTDRGPTP